MTNVWIAYGWADGADGDQLLGVYKDFEAGANFALRAVKEIEEDMYIHGECKTRVETKFTDGEAQYNVWIQYGENPEMISDVIVLKRMEVLG